MMLDADTQDWLDRLSERGPAQPPATIGEAWTAAWGAAGLHTYGGLQGPQSEALDALRGAYRAAAGADPRDDARAQGIPIHFATPQEEARTIGLLARGLPDEAQTRIAPHLDIDAAAQGIAARTERQAADVESRTFGLSATASLWAAGLARTMVDPVTLAATAAVAAVTPAGVGVPAFLAREAAVNAGAAAATHPLVSAEREKLGLAPTSFFQDVAEAGIGGAALGGLFRAGGWALRRAFRGEPTPIAPSPAARVASGALEPEDFDLAATHLENRAIVDAQAVRPDAGGVLEHGRGVDAAAAAIDRGEGPAAIAAERAAPDAEALVDAVTRKAYALSPNVFTRADQIDNRIAGARAEIARIEAQPDPMDLLSGRIAETEAALADITGKRRSSPRAQALRDELDALRSQRAEFVGDAARRNAGVIHNLRMSIVDMQTERARLGPKIRAVRAHAAQALGAGPEEIGAALRVAATRDERPVDGNAKAIIAAPEPTKGESPPVDTPLARSAAAAPAALVRQGGGRATAPKPPRAAAAAVRQEEGRGKSAPAPVGPIEPARPLSDYPLASEETDRALLPENDPRVRIVGRTSLGPAFDGFQGRWTEAVAHLRRIETGDARGVLAHPGVAEPIDVVWGNADKRSGFGLAKIIAKHPEVLGDLPQRLERMRVESVSANRIRLVDGATHAIVSLDYDGRAKTWLMTAYEAVRRTEGTTESPGSLQADSHSSSASPSAEDMPPLVVVKRKRTVTRRNPSLFEALAGGGGLAPHSELAAIFDGNPFVPGFGRLVRKTGMSLDDALRAAKEQGYLFDPADHGGGEATLTFNDLLDKLAEEASGRKVYRLGQEPMDPRLAYEADRRKGEYEDADKALRAEKGLAPFLEEPKNARVVELARQAIAEDGLSVRDAWKRALADYERELQERLDQFEPLQQRRVSRDGAIRGWDLPYDPEDPPFDATDPRSWPPGGDPFDAGAAPPERPGGAGVGDRPSAGGGAAGAGGRGGQSGRSAGGDAQPLKGDLVDGRPLRADAERALREAGDVELHVTDEEGRARRVRASELLREADEDAAAARELQACIAAADDEEIPF